MTKFEELKARGLIAQLTHEEEIKNLIDKEKITFYVGFDPTADSLHVGHLLVMIGMAHLQKAGHRVVALVGGGTGMVGDPTGKTDMRKMLTEEALEHNVACFKQQLSKFIDFSDDKAVMVNNADWLLKLQYIPFLREIGVHFSVNKMLSAECFKTRLEKGLSFIEFNYMLMQSYDFLKLFNDYGCTMQLGGDDQWANILGGVELIRRVASKEAYGMTFTLLTTAEGKKMGKTEKGALFLDPQKVSPYDFYQYWRNINDEDVIRVMKMLTFLPLEEIAQYEHLKDVQINEAKKRLAYELTKTVHDEKEAIKAQEAAEALFGGGGNNRDMPTVSVQKSEFMEKSLLELLVETGIIPSKGEGKRLILQGGLYVDEERIESIDKTISPSSFKDGEIIVRKGKKSYTKIVLN